MHASWRHRLFRLLLLAGCWLAGPASAPAQVATTIPSWTGQSQSTPTDPATPTFNSGVSWIDSAFPQSQVRVRGDFLFDSLSPQRAEYIWAKGIVPGAPGPSQLETKLDSQQVSSYIELAMGGFFSVFLETPYVWMNPNVNANVSGFGDTNAGLKFMAYAGQDLQLTAQLRAYFPTGRDAELGTHHYTLEPALLGHYNLLDMLQIEGEFRFWAPIGGTDFAGDMLRYGLGVSYGQRSPSDIWLMPVVELVGWTVLSGQTYVPTGPTTYVTQSAAGTTILNAYAGLRFGLGNQFDFYAGYGRGLTSEQWYRDNIRVEFRFLF
jgi:hypothetical protein